MKHLLLILALLAPAAARAEDASDSVLDALLKKGPVVSVATDDKGKFADATALIEVNAPEQHVWETITTFDKYKDFVPKVVTSEVQAVDPAPSIKKANLRQVDFHLEIEVPGSNPDYWLRYTLDDAKHEANGQWLRGDLKGVKTHWHLIPRGPTKTLVYYTTASKGFSSLAESLEDEQQTITVGVNVSAALATVKAVKAQAEKAAK